MDKVTVSADALRSVLMAIIGPSHRIKELLVIHDLNQKIPTGEPDPITTLISEFNAAVEEETQRRANHIQD